MPTILHMVSNTSQFRFDSSGSTQNKTTFRRAETGVFEPTADRPRKLAYTDTKVIESVARSPGGHWYPTRVVRKTSNSEVQQVSRYLLEFDAALPDELFKPLKL